ncbi:TIGR02281 family clan AA aspartic protease, partial [Hansschlegelia beijingensis]|uniref:retropepsin-like aspartic protease family protein n=1 Tax=Hansschlegelia beijingensis TaxID=1133344 RepID=UPI00387EFDC8
TIGGRRVPMLVDTGATVVALSFEQGEALGLVSGGDRFDARVATASGSVGAKRVVLRDVRIGSVKVLDVPAVVLTRGAMNENLLGMSFLGRLRRVETARDRLTLER